MLGVREDLIANLDFVSADHPYNVRRNVSDGNQEYDVLSSSEMKYLRKILGDVMRPERHVHVI